MAGVEVASEAKMSDTVVKSDSLREVYGKTLVELADPDKPNFYVFSADLAGGCGEHHFRKAFPSRHLEVGIAESAMMGIAAGFQAQVGVPVFVNSFATFLLRGLEPARLAIFHDKRNVRIVCSHLGLSAGPDGSSVQELSYIATWRSIPNSIVVWPADANELRQVLEWSLDYKGPMVIFTGRNPAVNVTPSNYQFVFGKGSLVYPLATRDDPTRDLYPRTSDVTLIACGRIVAICIEAARQLGEMGIEARVANLSTLKPVDAEFLLRLQQTSSGLITVEDHNTLGGLYSIVAEALAPEGSGVPIIPIAVQNTFGESGEPDQLYRKYGIGVEAVVKRVKESIG